MNLKPNYEIDTTDEDHDFIHFYTCPYCNNSFTITESNALGVSINKNLSIDRISTTSSLKLIRKGEDYHHSIKGVNFTTERNRFDLFSLICPNVACKGITFFVNSYGSKFPEYKGQFLPKPQATKFPSYVPKHIRDDINEAESIVDLSPKASATLSRRALQAMIRDFHGITKKNLHQEIEELKTNTIVSIDEYDALMGLKSIGNHSAHPNISDVTNTIIDIEENEAKDLILLIHHFINSWYVQRDNRSKLLSRITSVASTK